MQHEDVELGRARLFLYRVRRSVAFGDLGHADERGSAWGLAGGGAAAHCCLELDSLPSKAADRVHSSDAATDDEEEGDVDYGSYLCHLRSAGVALGVGGLGAFALADYEHCWNGMLAGGG